MTNLRLKLAIVLSYAIFAVLLNSVGTVILQSIEYFGTSKGAASSLEAFKDLPIAITSFLVASSLPRFGYRRGMMIGLGLVGTVCALVPLLDAFWGMQLLFLAIGVGFAVNKVAVYSIVGLLTASPRDHASLLNTIEGIFMLGVLGGYWMFSAFIEAGAPGSATWLQVYWWLAGASAVSILLLATTRFDESGAQAADRRTLAQAFGAMARLAAKPLTIVFIVSLFLYVLVEQGIGSWLPTFNRELLGLSAPMSVQAASIFAVGLAAGRLGAGAIVRRTGWFALLLACLAAMALLIIVALPLAEASRGAGVTTWAAAPLAAFILPLIGLFMAPIYPALNSVILSAMPRPSQSAMVGLIVVFSALGGTTGSFIVGRVFAATGGSAAFNLLLVPIAGIAVAVVALRRLTRQRPAIEPARPSAEAGPR